MLAPGEEAGAGESGMLPVVGRSGGPGSSGRRMAQLALRNPGPSDPPQAPRGHQREHQEGRCNPLDLPSPGR